MLNLSAVTDDLDIATKEYVDAHGGGGGGGSTITKLWDNPSYNSSFAAQTLTFSGTWDAYIITFIPHTSYGADSSVVVPINVMETIGVLRDGGSNSYRNVTTTSNSIEFGSGSSSDNYTIPRHIWGIKYGVGAGGTQMNWYGTCETAAGTAAKVVACDGFELGKGAIIGILFTTANTAATPTLNINSTGAIAIRVGNTAPSSTTNVLKWSANAMLFFMYDGDYYRYIGMQQVASNTQGGNTWYGTSSTAASTAAKTSSITNFKLTPGAIVSIVFSTANTYASGALTLNVNSTGAKTIYVNNAATSSTNTLKWEAGEVLSFVYSGSYWYLLSRESKDVDWTQSTYADGYYMRRGNMVSVVCESYGSITAPNNDYATVFTLPSGFRPVLPASKSMYGAASPLGAAYPVAWKIESDGKVSVGGNGTSPSYWAFSATFPCR